MQIVYNMSAMCNMVNIDYIFINNEFISLIITVQNIIYSHICAYS